MVIEGGGEVRLDDKAKRMRDLLSSFYSQDSSSSASMLTSSGSAKLDAINSASFNVDQYINLLVQKLNLGGLLQKHVEMAAEIKNLDTDLQMLVYENYNKFICATDTIKRMNNNIVGMEANMEHLLDKITSVQSKSDVVNTSLFEKREKIEKLHRTRDLLRKVQFIYDLPARLAKCIKTEAYADAVRYFIGAKPIFKAYGESSFKDCKKASEEAMDVIIKQLQEKLFSDSEPIKTRAEAVLLLKQLGFPVDDVKDKLLDKLEDFIFEVQAEAGLKESIESVNDESSKHGNFSDAPDISPEVVTHQATIREFADTVRAYRVIFLNSEKRLIEIVRALFTKRFETIQHNLKEKWSSADLLAMLRVAWKEIAVMDEVLPEAVLPDFSLEAAHGIIKQYVTTTFSHLLQDVSDSLVRVQSKTKDGLEEECYLQVALEGSKKALIQGSMDVLLDFRQLPDDKLGLLVKLKDLIIDWIQEGFQDFFRTLEDHFHMLSGRNISTSQNRGFTDGTTQGDKMLSGIVLVMAQLSIFIEQSAIPRITEEIAASFSGGGVRGYEYGPAFIPGEICRIFKSDSEKFLHLYINMKTQKISILLRKRFTTPNWIKHKEPREVHMFVDLLLQELESIEAEVKQILPRGLIRKHRRSESNGSTTSSRSNPRDDKTSHSNAQRARSHLLETHLAKLFKQKMEIFSKVEHTQESVVLAVVKLCLKSLQEFVRLQTFNRSGLQQVQLDIQFLRSPVKEIAEDEAAVDFLLDEVIVAAAERCLDPIPLESAILDKLIQAKLSKSKELNPGSLQ